MKKAWTILMLIFSCAVAQAQPYAGGVYPVKMLINSNPNPAGTPTWVPWNGKIEPTVTPTYTPTWNATTTRTQPPTATATATNTPVIVAEQSRCMKQADGYTTTCSSVAPAASPVPTVLPVPSPGYYWKYELSSMNIGTATGRRTMTKGGTACTENMVPLCPRLWCENGALNGAVTLGWIYDAGVTFRDTLKAAQLKGGR